MRFWPLLAAALLMSACATQVPQHPPVPETSWEQRQLQLRPLRNWQLQGKIAIRVNEQNNAANLSWTQRGAAYRIFMAGPLGRGAVDIDGDPNHLRLVMAGEEPYETDQPEALLHQQLGWSFPLQQLAWWARGLPAPNSPHRLELDEHQRLQQLEQSGWHIHYRDYQRIADTELPAKLVMTRGEGLRMTLVFKRWELLPEQDHSPGQKNAIPAPSGV